MFFLVLLKEVVEKVFLVLVLIKDLFVAPKTWVRLIYSIVRLRELDAVIILFIVHFDQLEGVGGLKVLFQLLLQL